MNGTYRILALLVLLASCGPSPYAKRLADAGGSVDDDVSGDSDTSSSKIVEIWQRSPGTDSGNNALSANDDLERLVPKSSVAIPGLANWNGLEQTQFSVLFNLEDEEKPAPKEWRGKSVPWLEKDFQAFMTYVAVDRSLKLIKNVFPDLVLADARNLDGQSIAPLKVEAAACCDAFETGYDPINRMVSFFNHGLKGKLKKFHMSDESDVVYHEIGHVLQHAMNPEPVESSYGENTDIDALLEGLSDYFAATVLRERAILSYTAANMRLLLSRFNRTGAEHQRSLVQNLAFPSGYRQDAHLDGRVVSGALADVAQVFINLGLEKGAAMDASLKLAMKSYALMTKTSTMNKFAKLVVQEFPAVLSQELCNGDGTCMTNTQTQVRDVLVARGLLSNLSSVTALPSYGVHYSVEPTLGFREFPDYAAFSNNNGILEPCEVVMVYPKVKNLSNAQALKYTFMDASVKLTAVSRFTEAVHPIDQLPLDSLAVSTAETKVVPWLNPGESTLDLIGNFNSRLYFSQAASVYSQVLSKESFLPATAWVVRAPPSGTATLQMTLWLRSYNADTQMVRSYSGFSASLTVTGSKASCN